MVDPLALLATAVLVFLPGYTVLSLWPRDEGFGLGARLLAAPAASMAIIPLVFLAFRTLGIGLDGQRIALLLTVAAAFAARGLWLDTRLARQQANPTDISRPRGGVGQALARLASPGPLLVYVLALAIGARLWSVRDLVMPNWWDSVHHTVIVQLLLDHGGLFSSWEPYAPLTTFTYHFGFHGVVASLSWLTGLAAPQAVLIFGQALNGLTVLGAYLLAQRLTGRPWAGVLAALVTGSVSLMPAYYVNWGRYTQLAGQIILPALMVVTVEAVERGGRRRLAVMAVLAAGLALTHYRVAIFYGAFVAALLVVRAWQNRRTPRILATELARLAAAALAALALAAPWVWNLWLHLIPRHVQRLTTALTPAGAEWLATYNSIRDLDYILPPYLLWTALAGLALGLWRRQRAACLMLLWVAGVFVAANPYWLGLPGTGEVSNHAVLIGLYIPLSVCIGLMGAAILDILPRLVPFGRAMMAAVVVLAGLWGAREVGGIVNPYFALVKQEDLPALAWIKSNTSADARFLVNSEPAYGGGAEVGTDAGWWLPLLAGRQATLPPLLYGNEQAESPGYAAGVHRLAQTVRDGPADSPAVLQALRAAGVSHVFVGGRGGYLKPQELAALPAYEAVYQQDGAWVFRINYGP
jgi:hypothetical protein